MLNRIILEAFGFGDTAIPLDANIAQEACFPELFSCEKFGPTQPGFVFGWDTKIIQFTLELVVLLDSIGL